MIHLATTSPAAPALTGLIPVFLLLVVGLILWAAGRRILKAGFAAAGLIVGGATGWVLTDVLQMGVSHWLVAAILGVVCACVFALAYRVPVAAVMGLVCGLAAALSVATAGELHDARQGQPAATSPADPAAGFMRDTAEMLDEASDWLRGPDDTVNAAASDNPDVPGGSPISADALDQVLEQLSEENQTKVDQARAWVNERLGEDPEAGLLGERLGPERRKRMDVARGWISQQIDDAQAWWERIPGSRRPTIAIAGAVGAIVGLFVGTLLPGISSTLVTGFGGSLLWLATLRILLMEITDGALDEMMPDSTTMNLVLWLVISLIGVAIQWTFRPKPTDTPG